MDFHFITRVIGFRESNMQTLGGLRKKFLGLLIAKFFYLKDIYIDKTSFIKIVHAHSNGESIYAN